MLLLSSGFDGAHMDIGNSKLDCHEKYHHGLDLTPADFEWATQQALPASGLARLPFHRRGTHVAMHYL